VKRGRDRLGGLADRLVLCGDAAHEHGAVLVRIEVRVDRIGKPALLAHLLHQSRRKAAAADDVIEHIGGDEIVVLAGDAAMAELCYRLRHAPLDDFARPPEWRSGAGPRWA